MYPYDLIDSIDPDSDNASVDQDLKLVREMAGVTRSIISHLYWINLCSRHCGAYGIGADKLVTSGKTSSTTGPHRLKTKHPSAILDVG